MGLFSATNNSFERLRGMLIPQLGKLISAYNESTGSKLYVEGVTSDDQFVGCVPLGENEFEEELQRLGFQRNPFASLKRLARTRESEEGSFRWIPPEDSNLDRNFQLHVILYDGSVIPNADTGETYIYAHWEYRWDTNPLKHYRGVDTDTQLGVDMMQTKLVENGIDFNYKLPPKGK